MAEILEILVPVMIFSGRRGRIRSAVRFRLVSVNDPIFYPTFLLIKIQLPPLSSLLKFVPLVTSQVQEGCF